MPFPLANTEFSAKYNCRIKVDCFGNIYEILFFPRKTFNPEDFEPWADKIEQVFDSENDDVEKDVEKSTNIASANRARRRIRDLIYGNEDLDHFVTLTLNKEKVDRYDYTKVIGKYNTMLSNLVQRKALKYLLVPELHKDGAIHFHGFINDALELHNSGHKNKNGQIVYNVNDYGLGYSTCVKVNDNRQACANYILKYITKQLTTGMIGGRYYLHGGDLSEPHALYCDVPYESIAIAPTVIKDGISFKRWTPELAYAGACGQLPVDFLVCQMDGEHVYEK